MSFGGIVVLPLLHRTELLDIGIKVIRISRTGDEALSCRDGIRADVAMDFHVTILPSREAVIQVYKGFGTRLVNDPDEVTAMFEARFLQVVKQCARSRSCEEIVSDPEAFRDAVLAVLDAESEALHGFAIDHAEVVSIGETAIEFLDPTNILDAEGIKKITEREAAKSAKRRAEKRERKKREAIERTGKKEPGG